MLLDFSITTTILQAGDWFSMAPSANATLGQAIGEMWKVIRDIFNILFIFSFIYIGIKTILNADDSGAKRSLGMLIIAALLINFSLYFTQVIIDFSNIAAVQVYNQIVTGGVGVDGVDAPTLEEYQDGYLKIGAGSIAGAFFNIAHISSLFGGEGIGGSVTSMKIIVYAIFMLIFLIVTGIVCTMAAMLLIKRFIALTLAMILSPLMFVGWILPAFSKYQENWRKGFLANAFFAPAFLFMMYLSLMVLQRLNSAMNLKDAQYTSFLNGADMEGDGFTIIFFFCLAIGFLYASIKVGEMMGAAGASSALKSLDAMKNYTSGAAQSYAYRNTAGRGLNQVVKQLDKLDQAADGGHRGARFLRAVGVDESVRRSVESASNKGIGGGRGREAVEKDEKTAKARTARTNQISAISDAIKNGADAAPNTAERNAMERAVKDASSAQILEMFKDDKDKINSIAGELSDSQVKAIMEDKEIDDATKGKFAQARSTKIQERLTNPATAGAARANIADVIGKADSSELSALGFETAKTNAGKLSAKQIEDWKDLTTTEKTQLKNARKDQLWAEFSTPGPTGVPGPKRLFDRIKNDEERSKLPDEILKNALSAEFLNTNVLTKIVDNPGISDADRATIKGHVMAKYPPIAPGVVDPTGRANHKKYTDFFSKNNAGQRY